MSIADKIQQKLQDTLHPIHLKVIDQSHLHVDHQGNDSNGVESHFKVEIASKKFDSLSKLKRHQLVYRLLKEEIQLLHAITFVLYDEADFCATKK